MHPKRSKYDTNPLDAEVAERAEEVWGQGEGGPSTEEFQGATSRVGPAGTDSPRSNIYSEAPTRRIDAPPSLDSSYPSVFVPPTPTYSPPPAPYQPPVSQFQVPAAQKPTSRNVEGLGLPEKWAIVMPYAPFYVGVARCSGTGAAYGNHSHCDVVWGLSADNGQLSGRITFQTCGFYFSYHLDGPRMERRHTSYRATRRTRGVAKQTYRSAQVTADEGLRSGTVLA